MLITKKIPWKQDPLRVFYNKFLDLAAIDSYAKRFKRIFSFNWLKNWRIITSKTTSFDPR